MLPGADDLIETFVLLPDWEARYAYLIDLGRMLPEMDQDLKTDTVLVPGCTSRVWLVMERRSNLCHFHVASDAAIVQGLCAVLMVFVQDQTAETIRGLDLVALFRKLNLEANLSPNRRNGFYAMVERVTQLVAA
jgi:cysteine desulfuration protein SufE